MRSVGNKVPTKSAVPTILYQRCFTIVPPVRATFRSSILCTRRGNPSEAKPAICDTDSSKSAIPVCSALLNASSQRHSDSTHGYLQETWHASPLLVEPSDRRRRGTTSG